MIAPRRLQLRRGNSTAISSYTGAAGELVVNTTNWTLYVHDGVTQGGYAATVNTASINGNISSITNGTALFGNIIPSANAVYSLGNITHQWKSLFVSNSTIYVGGVPLSIDASGNLTVNGNTIPTVAYVNTAVANVTVDLSSYALNANVTAANVGMKGYVDQANTIQSAQITAANVGMKGYVDNQTYSNVNVTSYLIAETNKNIHGNVTVYGNLTVNGNISYINVSNYVVSDNIINLADANPGDSLDLGFAAHRTPSGQPLQHTGLVRDASANTWRLFSNVVPAPSTTVDFTNAVYDDLQLGNVTSTGNITANYFIGYTQGLVGSITNLDSLNFSVENISALVAGNGVNIGAGGNNNLLVLPAEVMIQNVPLSVTSNIIFSDASKQTTAWTGTVDYANVTNAYSNVQVGVYTNLSTYAYSANVTAANVGIIGYIDQGNTIQAAAIVAANVGLKGYVDSRKNFDINGGFINFSASPAIGTDGITFNDGSFQTTAYTGYGNVQVGVYTNLSTYAYSANVTAANVGMKGYVDSQSFYSNTRVATYLQVGNIANVSVAGNVTATYFIGNGALLTGIVAGGSGTNYSNVNVQAYTESMGFKNYSNVNVAAYLNATGYNLYSNVNVASYLSTATINTTGNITAQYLTGNINITGNVVGTSPNVTIQAGGNVWIFDNTGNLTLPTNADIIGAVTFTGNVTAPYFIGNGALLTGIAASSNYSNVNVATYLPTYSGNIANIRLGPSGVLTFADGTTQITAGGGSYSNVQVAAYLTTGVNTAAPQIQLTNATSNFIRYNNVGVGAPTFTTANVGTRIIYWSSVDANTADYAVGIDAGTLWHGIPRATSGFAFKWYGGTTQIAMLEGTGLFTVANIKLSPSGNIMFPDGTTMTSAAAGTYSNVQVATYLPTYSGNVANVRLGVSGVLTFADGTTMTSAAAGTYSNVQVATYLPTYTGSLNASNILVTSANITIANIQATNSATNPGTGALRVMGGVGVAGAVVAGQLNSTGNVVANAISAYSLNTVANVVASVINAGTINSAGNVLAQNLIGTIATASQTNITAVGTLASLNVTGNVNSSNFVGSTPNVQLIANTSITTFDIYGNVTFPGNNVISSLGITMPTRPAFRINGVNPGGQSTANTNLKGSAITTIYNQGNYFNATTGIFTAPVAGIYEVLLNARVNGSFSGAAQLVVLKNGINSGGNIVAFWETSSNTGGATHFGVSGTVVLATGDYLSANILAGNITFDQNDNWSVTYLG